jgi:hypothetical protein
VESVSLFHAALVHTMNWTLDHPTSSCHYTTNNIMLYLAETGSEGVKMNCWHQDRNKWWGLRNTVMTLQVPQKTGNFLISPGLFKFQQRLCSMEWAGHYQTYIILPLHYCGTTGGTMAKLQTECPSIMGLFPEIYLIPKMPNQVCSPPSLLVNGHCMTRQLVRSSHEAHRSLLPGVQAKKAQKIPPLPNKPIWHAHNPLHPFTRCQITFWELHGYIQ